MPERRIFRGKTVRNAKRISVRGEPKILVTFEAEKGRRGPQIMLAPEEYETGLKRSWLPGNQS